MKPRPERGVGQGTFSTPPAGGSWSVLGSTPCLFWGMAMNACGSSSRANANTGRNLFPLDDALWREVADALALSPQQARIVELILQGKQDKDIAADLKLSVPTVRTYLKRVFDRVGVGDRIQLVLRVFALALERQACSKCRQKERHRRR